MRDRSPSTGCAPSLPKENGDAMKYSKNKLGRRAVACAAAACITAPILLGADAARAAPTTDLVEPPRVLPPVPSPGLVPPAHSDDFSENLLKRVSNAIANKAPPPFGVVGAAIIDTVWSGSDTDDTVSSLQTGIGELNERLDEVQGELDEIQENLQQLRGDVRQIVREALGGAAEHSIKGTLSYVIHETWSNYMNFRQTPNPDVPYLEDMLIDLKSITTQAIFQYLNHPDLSPSHRMSTIGELVAMAEIHLILLQELVLIHTDEVCVDCPDKDFKLEGHINSLFDNLNFYVAKLYELRSGVLEQRVARVKERTTFPHEPGIYVERYRVWDEATGLDVYDDSIRCSGIEVDGVRPVLWGPDPIVELPPSPLQELPKCTVYPNGRIAPKREDQEAFDKKKRFVFSDHERLVRGQVHDGFADLDDILDNLRDSKIPFRSVDGVVAQRCLSLSSDTGDEATMCSEAYFGGDWFKTQRELQWANFELSTIHLGQNTEVEVFADSDCEGEPFFSAMRTVDDVTFNEPEFENANSVALITSLQIGGAYIERMAFCVDFTPSPCGPGEFERDGECYAICPPPMF